MSNTAGTGAAGPEAEALLQRVAGMIAGARALPLSSSVKLDNKDEILELLREAIERLPEELREARWMIREREEFLAGTQRRADELVDAGRSEAQRLVQRTEILKEAQAQARRTLEEARQEAQRLRLEAEDYADQKLAQFEIVMERTLKTVASGRQKLSGFPERDDDPGDSPTGGIDTLPGRARSIPSASEFARRVGRVTVPPGSGLGLGQVGPNSGDAGPHSGEVPMADENVFDQDRF
jgi:multidrug efflux pump subunit AcrA (membrane-fusion protein)